MFVAKTTLQEEIAAQRDVEKQARESLENAKSVFSALNVRLIEEEAREKARGLLTQKLTMQKKRLHGQKQLLSQKLDEAAKEATDKAEKVAMEAAIRATFDKRIAAYRAAIAAAERELETSHPLPPPSLYDDLRNLRKEIDQQKEVITERRTALWAATSLLASLECERLGR